MSKSQEYLEHIFSDKLTFEKDVLLVSCDEDRKEIMTLLSKELCLTENLASEINFLKLKSINNLNFKNVSIVLVQLLMAELISLLKEKNFTRTEIENVSKNRQYLKFIYELVQVYLRRFSDILYKEVVCTFFDLVSVSSKPAELKKIVLEVIDGTKSISSFLEKDGSVRILRKPEQLWMRVKQASNDKSRQAQVFQVEITRLVKRIDELKLHISSIQAAKILSVDEVRNISPVLLRDMFTTEDIKLQNQTTMFSYIREKEILNILLDIALKAKVNSKKPEEKNDFASISTFFLKCKKVNNEKYIDEKLKEYKHELELKTKKYQNQSMKLNVVREKALYTFDSTLKRITDSMVYNFRHL